MVRFLLALACLAVMSVTGRAEDWPEFRGPTGQGHSSERGLPLEWSETKNIVWKSPVAGRGWSSPVVANGRVWLTTATDAGGGSLRLLSYEVGSGRLVTDTEVFTVRGSRAPNPKNSRASPTPIEDGDRVYVHFGADGTTQRHCRLFGMSLKIRNRPTPFHAGPSSQSPPVQRR